ncbi:MAG: GNAT family N-acetyltransferase [Pseudomonadota bacterium]
MTTSENQLIRQYEAYEPVSGRAKFASGKVSQCIHAGKEYVLECRDSIQSMREIKEQWLSLEGIAGDDFDYFQTFDWCFTWCENFSCQEGAQDAPVPQVFVLSCDGVISMIWPLMKVRAGAGLTFLESMTEPMGQYSNVLRDEKRVDVDIAKWVWNEIKSCTYVDAIALNHYPADGFLDQVLGDEGLDETIQYVSSILNFGEIDNWEAYTATFSKSQRKQRGRRLKKLEAEGELSFAVHFHHETRFAELVNVAIDMKREWLTETGRHSQSLFEDRSKVFLASLGQHVSEPKQGPFVFSMDIDGHPIAIEISMLKGDHYYSYLGAIDLKWKDFSPGKVQMELAQKWAMENDIQYYDFLSDPSDYKKTWTNMIAPMKTRYFPISTRGRIYCSLWKAQMKPLLRSLYQRTNPNMRRRVNKILGLES